MGWAAKREQKVFTSIYNAYTRKREPQFPKRNLVTDDSTQLATYVKTSD